MSDQAAPAESLNDRIGAALMGDPKPQPKAPVQETAPEPEAPVEAATDEATETEAASEAPAETADEFVEVEYEGERWSVPKKLSKAIIQESDYTKKTQEVADQRKQVEYQAAQLKLAESERQFAETVRPELTTLMQLDQQLAQFKALDWNNLSTDEAFRYKLTHDQLKEQKAALESELGSKRARFDQEMQAAYREMLDKGIETLKRSIPNFGEGTAKEIVEYAERDGYTKDEVAQIIDPRYIKTLWKAAQYDRLQSQSKATASTLQKVAPIGKAAPSNPMSPQTKDYLNYRKTIQKLPKGSQQHQAVVKDRIASIFGK
jgi:hypothetical protein